MFIFKSNVKVIQVTETSFNGQTYHRALVSFENGGLERVSCPADLPIGDNEYLFEYNNGKVRVL